MHSEFKISSTIHNEFRILKLYCVYGRRATQRPLIIQKSIDHKLTNNDCFWTLGLKSQFSVLKSSKYQVATFKNWKIWTRVKINKSLGPVYNKKGKNIPTDKTKHNKTQKKTRINLICIICYNISSWVTFERFK